MAVSMNWGSFKGGFRAPLSCSGVDIRRLRFRS